MRKRAATVFSCHSLSLTPCKALFLLLGDRAQVPCRNSDVLVPEVEIAGAGIDGQLTVHTWKDQGNMVLLSSSSSGFSFLISRSVVLNLQEARGRCRWTTLKVLICRLRGKDSDLHLSP